MPAQYDPQTDDGAGYLYEYDREDRLVKVTDPQGTVTNAFVYDLAGNLVKEIDGNGYQMGETDEERAGILYRYNYAGWVTEVRKPLERAEEDDTIRYQLTRYLYNDMGGIVTEERFVEAQTEESTTGRIHSIHYRYDRSNRLVEVSDSTGAAILYEYDAYGNRSMEKVRVDEESYRETHYEYSLSGRLVAEKVKIRKEDETGQTSETANESEADFAITRYAYDANGNVTQVILPEGGIIEYSYDADDRLIGERHTEPGGEIDNRICYSYDKAITASGKMLLENRYDLNGNRIGRKDISGKETVYEYDHLDRMSKVVDNRHESVIYQYNDNGTIQKMITGGMIITEYTYDADQNITGQKTYVDESKAVRDERLSLEGTIKNLSLGSKVGNSNLIVDNSYRYDNLGNLAEKKTLSGLTSYTYDAQNRLTRVVTPKGSEDYTYDRAGNRLSRILKNNDHSVRRHETYAYDAANRLLERNVTNGEELNPAGTIKTEYSYDKQGNMTAEKTITSDAYGTREQKTRTLRYDAVNRLSEVTENGKCLQKNTYDAEGLRSEMEENDKLVRFLYDGDKVVAESDETKGLKRYIRGYELVSSDCEQARTYYHYASDELGSITDVLNYKGEVLNHYEYDAFGEFSVREEQVENRFAFAGEQFDPATNLYYLRARFYNPVIGRFIQEDTYYGDGLNLYAYCHNNPVGYVDPSGHVCTDKQQAIHILEENGDPRKAKKEYNKLRKQYSSAAELREALEKKYGKSRFTDTYELRPNNKYTINGYTYVTDELGRIISARGDLRLENGKRFGNHQSKAGGIFRLKTDDGGHLFATIFGGSGKVDNIVPMDSNLNRGRYKALVQRIFNKYPIYNY